MIYLQLFLSFLQVGMFSVGGGYAAMPLIQSQVVEQHGWLTMQEFTDLITIAEMTPGPIAVNSATFVGLRWHPARTEPKRSCPAFPARRSSAAHPQIFSS